MSDCIKHGWMDAVKVCPVCLEQSALRPYMTDIRNSVEYSGLMEGWKMPGEYPAWLLNDVAILISRGDGFPISSDSCKEAVALVFFVAGKVKNWK